MDLSMLVGMLKSPIKVTNCIIYFCNRNRFITRLIVKQIQEFAMSQVRKMLIASLDYDEGSIVSRKVFF